MSVSRRQLIKIFGILGLNSLITQPNTALATKPPQDSANGIACLIDLSVCIGCRRCEKACNNNNKLISPKTNFDDLRVLQNYRHPDNHSHTVINRYYGQNQNTKTKQPLPVFVKSQCLHCLEPSCVNVCPVGAMTKKPNGAVLYDETRCIGCRYCLIACPFQYPTYEYQTAINPKVLKCCFCYEKLTNKNKAPACVTACPVETITFGQRKQLLTIARQRINDKPKQYQPDIYGEYEAGGTSWLYISAEPFANLGFLDIPKTVPTKIANNLQSNLYKNLQVPAGLIAILLSMGAILQNKAKNKEEKQDEV